MQQTKKASQLRKARRELCCLKKQSNKEEERSANWEGQEKSTNQCKKPKKGQSRRARGLQINATNKKGQMIKKSKKRGLLLKAAIKQRRWKVGQLRRAREVCQLMQQTKQRAKWEDQEVHGLMQQTKKVGQLRRARREACCSKKQLNKEDDERLADQEQKERSNDQCYKPKEWPIEKSKRPTDWCNKQKSSANQEEQEESPLLKEAIGFHVLVYC